MVTECERNPDMLAIVIPNEVSIVSNTWYMENQQHNLPLPFKGERLAVGLKCRSIRSDATTHQVLQIQMLFLLEFAFQTGKAVVLLAVGLNHLR